MKLRTTPKCLAAVAALTLTLGAADHAFAQDATPPGQSDASSRTATVKRLSTEGSELYQAHDYRHANEKFQQAYALIPDPNLLYNIAKCYEALGDKQAALEKYQEFINAPGGDPAGRVKAQKAVENLKAGASEAPHGTGEGQTDGGHGTPANPNESQPPSAAKPADEADASRRATPPPAAPSKNKYLVPALVSFGVGGAGLIVGTIFGVTSLTKRSNLDSVCSSKQCAPQYRDDISSLKTVSTVSTVGFIVGAVGAVAGGTLFVLGRSSNTEKAAGPVVSPYLSAGSAGLTGSF